MYFDKDALNKKIGRILYIFLIPSFDVDLTSKFWPIKFNFIKKGSFRDLYTGAFIFLGLLLVY